MKPMPADACVRIKKDLRFFRFLSDVDITILTPYFECRQVVAGDVLWREGDHTQFAAFVMSGRIEEKKNTEFDGRQVVIGVYSEGAVIGEFGLIEDFPQAVTAVCLEDAQLLLLPKSSLEKLLIEHPQVGIKFFKGVLVAMSIRLRKSFERLAAIF